uniref:(northern house mosquito) hypothetical protein n=1 Tax=Culex pipiens TaxID=7175 RepID=A0A8D8BDA4_CULPI
MILKSIQLHDVILPKQLAVIELQQQNFLLLEAQRVENLGPGCRFGRVKLGNVKRSGQRLGGHFFQANGGGESVEKVANFFLTYIRRTVSYENSFSNRKFIQLAADISQHSIVLLNNHFLLGWHAGNISRVCCSRARSVKFRHLVLFPIDPKSLDPATPSLSFVPFV